MHFYHLFYWLDFRLSGANIWNFATASPSFGKYCYFCSIKHNYLAMLNPSNTQGIYLNVPMTDWALLKELIRKFGWQAETREQLLNRFVKSRSNKELLSDEEIMEEVNAVRYGK